MKELQAEVEHLRGKNFDGNDLTNLKLLNGGFLALQLIRKLNFDHLAVINETLRVKTVVPSKSQRVRHPPSLGGPV